MIDMELNQQQVGAFLRTGLAAGGPLGALILSQTHMAQSDYDLYVNAFLFCFPLVAAGWGWVANRRAAQVKAVEQNPDVATVVVKDAANGEIAKLAQSVDHPNIVTETQNGKDKQRDQVSQAGSAQAKPVPAPDQAKV
jgi:hypothetical protein